MKQFRPNCNSYSLSLLTIVISCIAVVVAFSSANEKISNSDTLTVLSILVAVLMGWNILNYMHKRDIEAVKSWQQN